jgi:erythronate-4-phosphate dehydrogenase
MHAVEICTPHVAGYSMQSKWRGTLMLHKAFCEYAKLPHQKVPWPMEAPEHTFNGATWEELVLSIYDPREDSSRTRLALQDNQDVGVSFDQLRKSYPLRHEFAFPNIKASSMDTQHQERAERLGFRFC